MKLGSVIELDRSKPKTTWISYIDNFEVQIKYLPRMELRSMLEAATDRRFDRRTNSNLETLNPRKFDKELSKLIVNWKGLTLDTLGKLLPLKDDLDATTSVEIDCDEEAKLLLLEHAYGFDKFVQDACTEVANFESERQQEQLKN